MKNWQVYTLLLAAGIVLLGGCGSTSTTETAPPEPPPLESPRPQPQPQVQPEAPKPADNTPGRAALDALDAAIARAERERRRAEDFGAASRFPADWDSAEAGYKAITVDRTSPEGVEEAERLYNEAADGYNEIFRRSIALYVKDLEEELLRARSEAVAAGINEAAPEYLLTADQGAAAARELFTAEDYYAADKAAREALDRYRSLTAGAEACKIQEEVVRRDFAGFDADNFKRGNDALAAAVSAYEGTAAGEALDRAAEAKLRYGMALKAGWAAYAAQVRALAGKERQNAINAKANVAVKDDFANIERVFNQAESAYRSEIYEDAVNLYVRSEAGFVALTQAAEEKRRIAQAAIDAAEKKLEESEAAVRNAEGILEGDNE
ncbi:MAG: hypothetical protein LBB77_08640 [Treponema sp.]|nr:hypothetical protein [Treponema sp.]